MKKVRTSITRFLTSYMTTLGALHLLYYAYDALSGYGFQSLGKYSSIGLLVSAFLLASCHFIVTEEALDRKFSVKARLLSCILPCAAAMAIVVYLLNIPNWIPRHDDVVIASIVWCAVYVIAVLLFLLVFFLITQKNRRTAKIYNEALARYKQNNNAGN